MKKIVVSIITAFFTLLLVQAASFGLSSGSLETSSNIHVDKTSLHDVSLSVSSSVYSVKNGTGVLIKDTDYTSVDSTLTIKKSYQTYYFTKFPEQNLHLTVLLTDGSSFYLTFYWGESPDASINPSEEIYKKSSGDVFFKTSLNGNYISSIKNGGSSLVPRIDYTFSTKSSEIIVRESYIAYTYKQLGADKANDPIVLYVNFTGGEPQKITIKPSISGIKVYNDI
ncbi:MAG TPA: X2-like carbohydrate binding domain-containing protein, partial [Clostridia bacterium]